MPVIKGNSNLANMDKRTLEPNTAIKIKPSNIHYLKPSKLKKKPMPKTANAIIKSLKPESPLYLFRPHIIESSSKWFLQNFSNFHNKSGQTLTSKTLYAVKSNPEKEALKQIFKAGIRNFDTASLDEIKLIHNLFGKKIKMYFMHPIKPRKSIKEAYFEYGIRDFSLDCEDELKKILEVTKNAKDLNLHLRIAIPNAHSAIDLSSKFGIRPSKATPLMHKVRKAAKKFGICFHVGSQCMEPSQYASAILTAYELTKEANIKLDVFDIGGGFPSNYPGMTPPPMSKYIEAIHSQLQKCDLSKDCEIWCEPGRAISAASTSLVVKVESRKNNMLYINDGTYGGLFDAGTALSFIFPCKAYRLKQSPKLSKAMEPFGFYGPTCDSMDTMKGPFYLPKNIAEGDYIEIGQLGSYSQSLRTDFNGFNNSDVAHTSSPPLDTK